MTRPERGRLDKDKITSAALELLDEVGLDMLSTRALAGRLGVQSPALYWHFKNKSELVDAMAEAMLRQAEWPDPPRKRDDVSTWLAERNHAFRRALLAHRDGARVHAGTRPDHSRLPTLNAQIEFLTSAGFTPQDAARAILAISRYTIGWALEEQAARTPEEVTDLDGFPALGAAREIFEQRDPERDYDFGLRALIAGFTMLGVSPARYARRR